MVDTRDVKVSISLAEYTRLVIIEADFEKIKAIVNAVKDDYIRTDATALLKLICRERGGDNK